jgi:hypothetical protein
VASPAEQHQADVEHSAAILEAAGCAVVPLLRPIAQVWNLLGVGAHGLLLVHVVRGAWPEMLGLQSLGIPPRWPASTGRLVHKYTDEGSSPEVRLL